MVASLQICSMLVKRAKEGKKDITIFKVIQNSLTTVKMDAALCYTFAICFSVLQDVYRDVLVLERLLVILSLCVFVLLTKCRVTLLIFV